MDGTIYIGWGNSISMEMYIKKKKRYMQVFKMEMFFKFFYSIYFLKCSLWVNGRFQFPMPKILFNPQLVWMNLLRDEDSGLFTRYCAINNH